MSAYERLTRLTAPERAWLHAAPVIGRALAGQITREIYVAFLTEAFHHVRHTVPLLMAVGARLPDRQRWLQREIVHYLEEELGHEQWILADIAAAGGDAEAARESAPAAATDALVAYAYDTAMRRNPAGFFGMVYVLESTSVQLALAAADGVQRALALPESACTYLRSHGRLDREHVRHLAGILERLDAAQDLPAVVACARAMYWLYGSLFRSLEPATAIARPGAQAAADPDTGRLACG